MSFKDDWFTFWAIKFDVDDLSLKIFGGAGRNRTDDGGVAVRSITTLLPRLKWAIVQGSVLYAVNLNNQLLVTVTH